MLGAAGGVGTAAIQIAKAMGARVIAVASTDRKCKLCKSIGADFTINYVNENLRETVKFATEGKGPDVIYDPVGGDIAEPAFRSIAWRGRYLVVGFASGPIPALPLNLPLLKGASIVGVFWGDFARREPCRRRGRAFRFVADHPKQNCSEHRPSCAPCFGAQWFGRISSSSYRRGCRRI